MLIVLMSLSLNYGILALRGEARKRAKRRRRFQEASVLGYPLLTPGPLQFPPFYLDRLVLLAVVGFGSALTVTPGETKRFYTEQQPPVTLFADNTTVAFSVGETVGAVTVQLDGSSALTADRPILMPNATLLPAGVTYRYQSADAIPRIIPDYVASAKLVLLGITTDNLEAAIKCVLNVHAPTLT